MIWSRPTHQIQRNSPYDLRARRLISSSSRRCLFPNQMALTLTSVRNPREFRACFLTTDPNENRSAYAGIMLDTILRRRCSGNSKSLYCTPGYSEVWVGWHFYAVFYSKRFSLRMHKPRLTLQDVWLHAYRFANSVSSFWSWETFLLSRWLSEGEINGVGIYSRTLW